jgi:hypothetical protein
MNNLSADSAQLRENRHLTASPATTGPATSGVREDIIEPTYTDLSFSMIKGVSTSVS